MVRTANRQAEEWIKTAAGIRCSRAGQVDVTFQPFYQDLEKLLPVLGLFYRGTMAGQTGEYREEKRRQKDLEDRSIDFFRHRRDAARAGPSPHGQRKSGCERCHGYPTGAKARAGNYFAFDMKVEPAQVAATAWLLTS